jgi:hypothetical protein
MPFRGYVCIHSLRPDDSLTILSMASSIGFQDSVFLPPDYPSYRVLTFTLVGLLPTECASLRWTTPSCRFIPAHCNFLIRLLNASFRRAPFLGDGSLR